MFAAPSFPTRNRGAPPKLIYFFPFFEVHVKMQLKVSFFQKKRGCKCPEGNEILICKKHYWSNRFFVSVMLECDQHTIYRLNNWHDHRESSSEYLPPPTAQTQHGGIVHAALPCVLQNEAGAAGVCQWTDDDGLCWTPEQVPSQPPSTPPTMTLLHKHIFLIISLISV